MQDFLCFASSLSSDMFVISQDFETIYIRKREHWNAYTTEYFIDVDAIIAMLENDGKVVVDQEHMMRVLYGCMHCPNCGTSLGNVGDVKRHIKTGCLERILPPKFKAQPLTQSTACDGFPEGKTRSSSRERNRKYLVKSRSRSRSRSESRKHLYSSSSDSDSDVRSRGRRRHHHHHSRRHRRSQSSFSSSASSSGSSSDSESSDRGGSGSRTARHDGEGNHRHSHRH